MYMASCFSTIRYPRTSPLVGFKNTKFLNFFFNRLKPNPLSPTLDNPDRIAKYDILTATLSLDVDWDQRPPFLPPALDRDLASLRNEACRLADLEGYEWISPCGPELNLVKTQDTPIVFRELSLDGMLKYAGDLEFPFRPDECVMDRDTGYLYHSSPTNPPTRGRSNDRIQYGRHSLLSSNLVLTRLADGLEMDADQFGSGYAGSFEWQGKRHRLGLVHPTTGSP